MLYSKNYCVVWNGMTSGSIRAGWIRYSCHTTFDCISNQHRVGANCLVPQFGFEKSFITKSRSDTVIPRIMSDPTIANSWISTETFESTWKNMPQVSPILNYLHTMKEDLFLSKQLVKTIGQKNWKFLIISNGKHTDRWRQFRNLIQMSRWDALFLDFHKFIN